MSHHVLNTHIINTTVQTLMSQTNICILDYKPANKPAHLHQLHPGCERQIDLFTWCLFIGLQPSDYAHTVEETDLCK